MVNKTNGLSRSRTPLLRTSALLATSFVVVMALFSSLPASADGQDVWAPTGRLVALNDKPVASSFCPVWVDQFCGNSRISFGSTMDLDGDTAIVGAPAENQVHIYERIGPVWHKTTILDGEGGFGSGVAVEGDFAVTGAPEASQGVIWARSGGQWIQDAVIEGDGCLGWRTSIAQERVVLGDSCAEQIHVIERIKGDWTTTAVLEFEGAERLGHILDSSESTVAAASRLGVIVFEHVDDNWEETRVTSRSPWSFGISGGTLAVGVLGVVTVYERDDGDWVETTELSDNDASPFDLFNFFGRSLAVQGDTIVVGAPNDDSFPGFPYLGSEDSPICAVSGVCIPPRPGAAYVFEREEESWTQRVKLVGDPVGDGRFGSAVTMNSDGTQIAVGAPFRLGSGVGGPLNLDPENSVHIFTKMGV